MSRLTVEQAEAVYDVLVTHAGAPEFGREGFVTFMSEVGCDEYRFQGLLGFGGKFWPDERRGWRVTAYPEDERRHPAITDRIKRTNAALHLVHEYGAVIS